MYSPNDGDLREHFRAWRDEVERMAPPFRRPLRRARRPRRAPIGVAAAVLAMVVIGTVWMVSRRDTSSPPNLVALDATWWVAPTDFLLMTPGIDLLRSVPNIGVGLSAPDEPAPLTTDTAVPNQRT